MKIQWLAWILVAGFAGAASTRGADIFRAGFETTDTPSYEVGQQLHQAGDGTTWSWNGDNIGVISTNEVARYAGDQGLDAIGLGRGPDLPRQLAHIGTETHDLEAQLIGTDARRRDGMGGVGEDEDPLTGQVGRVHRTRVPGQP